MKTTRTTGPRCRIFDLHHCWIVGLTTLLLALAAPAQSSVFDELYSFGQSLDSLPHQLLRAEDGGLYTVLNAGGRLSQGLITRFGPTADSITNLFDLASATTNEALPGMLGGDRLIAVANGEIHALVRAPYPGGHSNLVFRLGTNGSGFAPIHLLPDPIDHAVLATDGRIYACNGTNLFRVKLDGSGADLLRTDLPSFVQFFAATDGNLYGNSGATIYRIPQDGAAAVPVYVSSRLIITLADAGDGRLIGTEDNFPNGQTAFAVAYAGSGYQSLGSLSSGGSDSNMTDMTDGEDGSLYGFFFTGPLAPQYWLARITKAGGTALVTNLPAGHVGRLTLGSDNRLLVSVESGGPRGGGFIYSMARDGTGRVTNQVFGIAPGTFVQSQLTYGSDGRLYATTATGGLGNRGLIFSIEADGTRIWVLREFASSAEGASPRGGVIEGSDGRLYGTTQSGGATGGGTVFRLNRDGTDFSILTSFGASSGINPVTRLIEGSDGLLYGTCTNAVSSPTNGTLWSIQKDGGNFTVLKTFAANGGEGRIPFAPLLEGIDGWLYGTTYSGGSSNRGTIFKIARDGSGFQTLRHLTGFGDAAFPQARLFQLPDGSLIAPSSAGGTAGLGSIFTIQTNGTAYQVRHSFLSTGGDGRTPMGGLVVAPDGTLFGTTRYGGGEAVGTIYSIRPDGTDYTNVHRFSANYPSGMEPWAALTQGPTGTFYGTTTLGGLAGSAGGTLFRLTFAGNLPPPMLSISFPPTGIEITWPEIYADFDFESAMDPGQASSWQPVLPKPTASNGLFRHTPNLSTSPAFFRLVKRP
jgi:uncharacterized repeat protein (TIGR03803 family)